MFKRVGVDAFGELDLFIREASSQHATHPDAVTRGLMRHAGVKLLEIIAGILQTRHVKVSIYHPGKLVRGGLSGKRRASIRKTNNHIPIRPGSRDTSTHL
jgi:hypothetical protein